MSDITAATPATRKPPAKKTRKPRAAAAPVKKSKHVPTLSDLLALLDASPNVVFTLPEFETLARISPATHRRLRAAGKGPTITNLSDHRLGVTGKHAKEWLASRAGA